MSVWNDIVLLNKDSANDQPLLMDNQSASHIEKKENDTLQKFQILKVKRKVF